MRVRLLSWSAIIAATLAVMCAGACAPRAKSTIDALVKQSFAAGLDSLHAALELLERAAPSGPPAELKRAFRETRRIYKHHEALLASAGPTVSRLLNGPLPEDDEGPRPPLGGAAGFQRVESRIFGADLLTTSAREDVQKDLATMRRSVFALRELAPHFALTENHVLEAMRTELAQISVWSLAGLDSDESGDAVVESAHALDGMQSLARLVARTSNRELWNAFADSIELAAQFLRKDTSFETANRLRFVAFEGAAIGRSLNRLRRAANGIDSTLRVVWRSSAATVFENAAFDASAYAPVFALRPTAQAIALGQRLFHEPRLSGDGTRACATCHVPQLAFADGLVRHAALGRHEGMLARNTPTLLNVALQPSFFADARVRTLEEQIASVLASPQEMSGSAVMSAEQLRTDSSYREQFVAVIGAGPASLSEATLRSVLATYVRSLVHINSRFDRAVQGDTNALTPDERRGFTVFMGKGRCGTCHFAPLFGGVIPPRFAESEFEIIGVPSTADTVGAAIDVDAGRAGVDSIEVHRHAFSVPTLRNAARTAPYMHNGVYATLEQVVDFYDRGGGRAIGVRIPYQTLPTKPLKLSADEKRALIAFMQALTDRAFER